MAGPEKNVENSIRAYIKSVGGWTIKIFANEMQGRGYPDLLICYKGRFLAFETKAPEGKIMKLQAATLKKIAYAGGVTASPRTLAYVKQVIAKIDAEA